MIKRAFTRKHAAILCLAAMSVTILAPFAYAGKWVQKEVKWHLTSVGTPTNPTGIFNRDTTYRVVSPAQLDTTGDFSLSNADIFRGGHAGAATTVDTCLAGYLVIQGDSTVAIPSSVSALTVEFDGRAIGAGAPGGNAGWTQVDSLVYSPINSTSGTDGPTSVIILPIRATNGLGAMGGSLNAGTQPNSPFRLLACESLRARFTAITGSMTAARIFVRYWDSDPNP